MAHNVCTFRTSGKVTVVRITEKKLYQEAVNTFQETMIALLEEGHRNLIIDMTGVDIINSSGLGVLILTRDRLNKIGGHLVLTGLRPFLEELFQRMRLDLLFTVVTSEEEALSLLNGD